MNIKIANGKRFTFDVKYLEDKDIYDLYIIDLDTFEKMGYISYTIENNKYWIHMLHTYEKYQNQGIGYALLNCLEYFAYYDNVNMIEGKFCPKNEFAKPLYDKCGYSLKNAPSAYPIIYKNVDKAKIEKDILPKISYGSIKNEQEKEF